MKKDSIQWWLVFVFTIVCVHTSAQSTVKEPRILILLDGSSSMLQPWLENQQPTRFKTAARIITRLMDSVYGINKDVEFGLRVYGHQHPVQEQNCYDTRQEVMFSKDNLTQMALRLESLHPAGISPIAFSLRQAAEVDFINTDKYSYSLVLITDGGENCNGDICAVAKELLEKKIEFRPYIISLIDHPSLPTQYHCLGEYLLTASEPAIPITIETIIKQYRRVIAPKPKTGTVIKVAEIAPPKPAPVKQQLAKLRLIGNKGMNLHVKMRPITMVKPKPFTIVIDTTEGFGYVLFINTVKMSESYLFSSLDTQFIYDKTLKLPGVLAKQKFKLRPGKYKLVYWRQTDKLLTTATFKEFFVEKDITTELNPN